jgi:hypothetical protein
MLAPDEPDEKRSLDEDEKRRSLNEIVLDALEEFAKGEDAEEPKEQAEEPPLPFESFPEDRFIDGREIENPPAEELSNPDRGELFALAFRSVVASALALFPADQAPIPLWGYRRENLKHMKIVTGRVAALLTALQAAPERALFLLFAPDIGSVVPSIAVQERMKRNLGLAMSMLLRLRKRGIELIAAEPGEHGSADFLQHWVAEEAVSLLKTHYKRVSNSSAKSLLRITASLLFEAIAGKAGKDLERACRIALQD